MLDISQTHAHMGKISNNLEKHGTDDVTAFDIPISGILLDREQLNDLLEDPHADRWMFNETKSGAIEPATRAFEPRVLKDTFEKAVVVFTVGKAEFTLADCKIQGIELDPENGGNTRVAFKLRVRPENDKQILALLGHQNREIKIDVAEATVAEKGGRKQSDLFAGGESDAKPDDEQDEHAAAGEAQAKALNGSPAKTPKAKRGNKGTRVAH